jgi:hypothetical protein
MKTSVLIQGVKKISIFLLVGSLLFAVMTSTGCSSLRKNSCGCPSKRGLGGY